MQMLVYASDEPATVDHVVCAAMALKLYDDPQWLALGHYRQNGKGWKSTVDDPQFFLAVSGKTNPKAELEETIRAVIASGTNSEECATSRFVARLAWIRERGVLPENNIPILNDTPYERLFAEVRPTKIVLAFPAPSADGISTAFGHIFLIFVQDGRSPLLAPTVNYAALIEEDGSLLYPILGLTGGLKAYYTALSYAEQLNEYNSIACRDMWEYELALTPEEVERVFKHTWEMRQVYSRYYFMDENCSYGVLALLDVARPGLCSASFDHRFFVFPLDVIRHLRRQGLINSVRFKPSILTSMREQAQNLSLREIATAKAMAYGNKAPADGLHKITNAPTQATLLEVAMSLAQIRAASGKVPTDEQQRIVGALIRAIPNEPTERESETASILPPFPEVAHRPSRLSVGTVVRKDSLYWAAAFRPAYHDFLDSSEAIDPAVQLQVLATDMLFDEKEDLAEWSLCLLDMEAFSPCDAVYAPLSHKLKISTTYSDDAQSTNHWNGILEGGLGFSYSILPRTILYGMGEVEVQTRTIQNTTWLGIGPSVGMASDLPWRMRVFVDGGLQLNSLDPDIWRFDLTGGFSAALTRQVRIAIQYSQEKTSGVEAQTELRVEARFYF